MTVNGHAPYNAVRAAELILERGVIGFIWLDEQLVVRSRRGALTDWVQVDEPHTIALPFLVGYETTLARLQTTPQSSQVLPNVGLHLGAASPPKFDTQIFWLEDERHYLVVLRHESTQSMLEIDLHREVGLRRQSESREIELARLIKRTNGELTRANRDLEEFAYVISHDLRAPLRAMRITADLLERELGPTLQDEAKANLANIRLLSRRMGAMMSGLLEYARVGRKQDVIADVDTARLVRDIIQGIGAPPGLPIVPSGTWPTLTTLADPLDVVLRNLIENAVKHHDTKRGAIVVTAHDQGDSIRFEIADDGPGIDPSYHEAIFEPFRTVTGETSEESSGIGLALVKKTAEVVGARIEVVSAPALRRGTTFNVIWPKIIRAD
jgi:signal transduction histidine kinase